MRKRIVCVLCALVICCGMLPAECNAAAVDVSQPCSLTLTYSRNGHVFSGLDIDIYRVAELCDNGEYRLLEPFSDYPIKIYGITSQSEWRDTAQTIKNYIVANRIEAYQSQKTNSEGRVSFVELEAGLYMVKGTKAGYADGVVTFQDFMIYVPNPVNGVYHYDVAANPKSSRHTPSNPEYERYTVVKLWQDAADSSQRPESVCIEILKDGAVQKNVILNSSNNWSYSWDVSNSSGNWSVIERDVPDGYQVSITNSNTRFTITNSKSPDSPDTPDIPDNPNVPVDDPDIPKDKPDKPDEPIIIPGQPVDDIPNPKSPLGDAPKTGDTSPLLLYMIMMCVSGFVLMILGVLRLREGKYEKKR